MDIRALSNKICRGKATYQWIIKIKKIAWVETPLIAHSLPWEGKTSWMTLPVHCLRDPVTSSDRKIWDFLLSGAPVSLWRAWEPRFQLQTKSLSLGCSINLAQRIYAKEESSTWTKVSRCGVTSQGLLGYLIEVLIAAEVTQFYLFLIETENPLFL